MEMLIHPGPRNLHFSLFLTNDMTLIDRVSGTLYQLVHPHCLNLETHWFLKNDDANTEI